MRLSGQAAGQPILARHGVLTFHQRFADIFGDESVVEAEFKSYKVSVTARLLALRTTVRRTAAQRL